MKINEAIEKFNEWRGLAVRDINGYDVMLRHFCIFLRNPDIEEVRMENVLEWLNWIKMMKFSSGTLTKKVQALRKFFGYFRLQGYKVIDPLLIPYPPVGYALPRVANEKEYQMLLDAIPRKKEYHNIRNRALLTILWDSGARLGEIVSLNAPDLDTTNRRAIIKTEKTKGFRPFREIFWRPQTNECLEDWLTKREKMAEEIELEEPDALFISIKGGYVRKRKNARGKRLARSAASDIFRKLSNRAGLSHYVNAHSFRHHFGHELAKRGANNTIISSFLGHSNLNSSFRYTELSGKEMEEQYEKLMK